MNKLKFACLFLLLIFQTNIFAKINLSDSQLKKLRYFERSCDDKDLKKIYKNNKERPNRLLLIDATDPLTEAQKQYLRDNYINGIDWKNKGEYFSMVLIDNKDISKLDRVTICSPLREDQITWTMAKNKEKRLIRAYKKLKNDIFNAMVNQDTTADSTKLIETLYAIYSNKRFNFLTGKRALAITSDLMQISKEVDLRCKGKCPQFKDTLQKKKNWFRYSKLKLQPNDLIEMYYFQTKCRVNLETLGWWEQYFLKEGISQKNLFYKAENGASEIKCDGSSVTTGASAEGGPQVLNIPISGQNGFTGQF